MLEIRCWMKTLCALLQKKFASELLFVGLQGSYQRGEATEKSDVDVVLVLNRADQPTLDAYAEILSGMPEAEKACGFVCGREDLLAWPRYELFHLRQDTAAYYGNLSELLPPITTNDILDGIQIGAANIYHAVRHSYLYQSRAQANPLRNVYKSAFFVLQDWYYLENGIYLSSQKELSQKMNGDGRAILEVGLRWDSLFGEREQKPDQYYLLLLRWSTDVLRLVQQIRSKL